MERQFPKNVKQIGNVSDSPRIYVEDYVETFLNQLEEQGREVTITAFLLGEKVQIEAMSRDELEQNIVELTTQVESQKQKIRWLQEQFNLLQQKRFGTSSEKDMGSGEQMSLFNEAEWTADEAEGQIPEPDMGDPLQTY